MKSGNMKTGKFITIEGIEGAGKSTAMEFVRDTLIAAGNQVITTREPGGTSIAENIRHVLLQSTSSEIMRPETELLLMFAGRAQHLATCIEPALKSGSWVVSDRFVDASYAYQGGGRGIDEQYIAYLDRWLVDQYYPNLTLLLDLPPDLGLARAAARSPHKDRIEQEKVDFFARVRQAYLTRAEQDPKRIKIINAGMALEDVHQQIHTALKGVL